MRLIDILQRETASFHRDVDDEVLRVGSSAADYRHFLIKTFGFVAPSERSITTTTDIAKYLDVRRFEKQELLRSDLRALRFGYSQINSLPQCSVPLFETAAEALGWAYVLERSTLAHHTIFVHFAATLPGEVAFASSYLKCYVGSTGEMWRAFAESLDAMQREGKEQAQRVVDGALTAFHFYRRWHELDAPAAQESPAADATPPPNARRPLTAD